MRFYLSTVIAVFLVSTSPHVSAQTGPLTYPKILTALNATLPKGWTKEKLIETLIADVKKLKVDKPLSADLEDILRQAGATYELLVAIRENSPVGAGTVRKTPSGIELVWIPPGEFIMGSSERDISESLNIARKESTEAKPEWFDNQKPQHRVTISKGFWMGRFEVTQAQWRAVMGNDPRGNDPSNFKGCDTCPVEEVSWDDIQLFFLRKINQKNDGFEYRLPTEAEWEYAARAGTTTLYGGTGSLDNMGWYDKNSNSETHPVGTKQPNFFGLYDMHGNVWEWCEDWYGSYPNGPLADPTGPQNGESRVFRGGSWSYAAVAAESAWRLGLTPAGRNDNIGFRVAARAR